MAQHGVSASGENSGHPAAALRQTRVPDGVDALVDPMQPARPDAMVDRLTAETKRDELLILHDAVLPRGKHRNGRIHKPIPLLFSHSE
ncbi:MAG TPA: hypothetical protein VF066_00200 [Thermoleophilaceae bacterium]